MFQAKLDQIGILLSGLIASITFAAGAPTGTELINQDTVNLLVDRVPHLIVLFLAVGAFFYFFRDYTKNAMEADVKRETLQFERFKDISEHSHSLYQASLSSILETQRKSAEVMERVLAATENMKVHNEERDAILRDIRNFLRDWNNWAK